MIHQRQRDVHRWDRGLAEPARDGVAHELPHDLFVHYSMSL
jgi:hypothetical protein